VLKNGVPVRFSPDRDAMVRFATDEGFRAPPKFGGPPVTNIRNTSSPHWRGWLKPKNRCLVPVNSFAEYAPEPDPDTKKKDVVRFALNDERPPVRLCRHLDRVQR
jgi:putative SOS response-associated peptidase YedK